MASYRKRGNVWQAIVDRKGYYKAESFPLKAQAVAWATKTESDIISGKLGLVADKSVGDVLQKFADEVAPKRPGGKWEITRIGMTQRLFPKLMTVRLENLTEYDMAKWRDARLQVVSNATVRREWNLLSKIFSVAMREWKWMKVNPLFEIDRPPPGEDRDRRITDNEIERILFAAGYDYDTPPHNIASRVGAMFLFAIETAMRCKEMCILRWDYVNFEQRTALVPKKSVTHTKTGGREVPLTFEAIRILHQLEQVKDGDLVFNLKEAQVDANFRKYKSHALIEDLHFHDTKHEAITRLASQMRIEDLARAVGTRNLKILMGYYNKSAADIAKGLK
jgi:integrase